MQDVWLLSFIQFSAKHWQLQNQISQKSLMLFKTISKQNITDPELAMGPVNLLFDRLQIYLPRSTSQSHVCSRCPTYYVNSVAKFHSLPLPSLLN